MMKDEAVVTCEIADALRVKLHSLLTQSQLESQFFVDLADIHEVCRFYLTAIEKILNPQTKPDALNELFYKIDVQLFEHLPYHLKSLKKLLPGIIKTLEQYETDTR